MIRAAPPRSRPNRWRRAHNGDVATTRETDGAAQDADLDNPGPGGAAADIWRDYAEAGGFVGIATVLALPLRPHLAATNLAMVYLLAVLPVALRRRRAASVLASFL